jgi:Exonuclease VII small subunit
MPKENKKEEDTSFEAAIARIEEIVDDMEAPETGLDAKLKLFEEGRKLLEVCRGKLAAAERKVEIIVKSKNGAAETEPFEE